MAKIDIKNYLTKLGIHTDTPYETVQCLTDQEVEDYYIEKLLETYMELKNLESQEEQDEAKQELYNQVSKMPVDIKINIIKNRTKEMAKTVKERGNLNLLIGMYDTAYEALKTEEQRKQYLKTLHRQVNIDEDLKNLIIKNNGNPEQLLRKEQLYKGNLPNTIRIINDNRPEYNVDYEDEDIILFHLMSYMVGSVNFQDKLEKKMLFIKNSRNHIGMGYDFYGDVRIIEMKNQSYRVALFQAIRQTILEGEMYLGSIDEHEDGYCISKDEAQQLAVMKIEKHEKENREKEGESR